MTDDKPVRYKEARAFVIKEQRVSTSGIQRHLKISYNAAIVIMKQLEADGVVSPAGEKQKREVLIDHIADKGCADAPTASAEESDPLSDASEMKIAEGWDVEGEQKTALDRMGEIADNAQINIKGMVYDVRDTLLEIFKTRPKPWSAMPQGDQRATAAELEQAAEKLINKIIEAVATEGIPSVRVLLTKVTMGTDMTIAGKVKTYGEEEADFAVKTLHHAINGHVMLTVASLDDIKEGSAEAETDVDEPNFGFEGDEDQEESEDGEEDEALSD